MSGCLRLGPNCSCTEGQRWREGAGDTSTVGAPDEQLQVIKTGGNTPMYVRQLETGRRNLYKLQQFDPGGT